MLPVRCVRRVAQVGLDADRAMEEAVISMKRAGADLILTYAAAEIAEKL